jgi:hypothetical protein
MGFIDTTDESIYNADNTSVLRAGTADLTVPVDVSLFTVVVNGDWPRRIRMFDIKRYTSPTDLRILYTFFTTESDDMSEYYIYNNGTHTKICDGGKALLNPGYQLGAVFHGSDKVALIRNANGNDIVEIGDYAGTVVKTIYSEPIGSIPIRNCRPVSNDSGEVILWQRGYYNQNNYKDFDMDSALFIGNEVFS